MIELVVTVHVFVFRARPPFLYAAGLARACLLAQDPRDWSARPRGCARAGACGTIAPSTTSTSIRLTSTTSLLS